MFKNEYSDFTVQSEDQLSVLVESGQNGIIRRIKNRDWYYYKFFGVLTAWVVKLIGGVVMACSADDFQQASLAKEANDTGDYDEYEAKGVHLFKSGLIMLSVASFVTVPHSIYTLYECIKNRCNGSSCVSHIETNRSELEDLLLEDDG